MTYIHDISHGECIGRVESDGRIYDSKYGNKCVGRIETDGKVYGIKYGGSCVGRVDPDGRVYDRKYGGKCGGRIESNGKIFNSKNGGNCVSRANKSTTGAAALSLLLTNDTIKSHPSKPPVKVVFALIFAALIFLGAFGWMTLGETAANHADRVNQGGVVIAMVVSCVIISVINIRSHRKNNNKIEFSSIFGESLALSTFLSVITSVILYRIYDDPPGAFTIFLSVLLLGAMSILPAALNTFVVYLISNNADSK